MTDDVIIRPARGEDRDFIVGLVPSLLEFGSPVWRDPGALTQGYTHVLALAIASHDDRAGVFVAEGADGTPLGFISLKVVESIGGGERGKVADLAVTRDARRAGVGAALMEAAEAWACNRGLDLVVLDVWATNQAALSFYQSLGYVPESLSLVKRVVGVSR